VNHQELPALPEFRVTVAQIYLVHARFLDTLGAEPGEIPSIDEAPLAVSLAFGRTRPDRLTIAIGVTLEIESPYRVEVMYAGEFVMHPDVPEEQREDKWKRAASSLAPVVLYPYIRETIQNLTARSQSEVLVLPVLSFAGLQAEEIELPPLPGAGNEQLNMETRGQ
jgi:hypothetical protein